MCTEQITKEHGKSIGRDARFLKSIGATDQQICNYVKFSGQQVPANQKEMYMTHARMSFTQKHAEFDHPIFNAYKDRMRTNLQIGAACFR